MAVAMMTVEEVLEYLRRDGVAGVREVAFYERMIPRVEAAIRAEVGSNITQGTYTEYYPGVVADVRLDPFTDYYATAPAIDPSPYLVLDNAPVTAVAEVRVVNAGARPDPAAFGPATVMAASGYTWDDTRLIRAGGYWPTARYGVMVTYTGGLTQAQIDSDPAHRVVNEAALETMAAFVAANSAVVAAARRGAAGPVTSVEFPDFKVTFAAGQGGPGFAVTVPPGAKAKLQRYMRYRL
jgi:hypothetical protein